MKGCRETNTMPQWAGSCWYYLRYIDPDNDDMIIDPKLVDKWLPVDIYIGGAEHAVLHLLYARFWHKFLYDIGVVPTKEPFQKLYNQGMILGTNNEKMSKSKGNVINPDDIVQSHGADTLRLYEMFMGPLDEDVSWSTTGLDGARRFLDRTWRLIINEENLLSEKIVDEDDKTMEKIYNETEKNKKKEYEKLHINTTITQIIVFVNKGYKVERIAKQFINGFVKLLYPIAPHIGEELWSLLGHNNSITYEEWPTYDEEKITEAEVEIVVQVLGKVRSKLTVAKDISKEELEEVALKDEKVQPWLEGKTIRKVIVVPGKLVNIVAN